MVLAVHLRILAAVLEGKGKGFNKHFVFYQRLPLAMYAGLTSSEFMKDGSRLPWSIVSIMALLCFDVTPDL